MCQVVTDGSLSLFLRFFQDEQKRSSSLPGQAGKTTKNGEKNQYLRDVAHERGTFGLEPHARNGGNGLRCLITMSCAASELPLAELFTIISASKSRPEPAGHAH